MNHDIASACKCFGLYDKDKIVGFCAVMHHPHSVNKKIKRVSRIVILPDYQGIGLGYKFLNIVAERYSKQGFDVSIVTSAKNFIQKLAHSEKWRMCRLGVTKQGGENRKYGLSGCVRTNCKTATFFYAK